MCHSKDMKLPSVHYSSALVLLILLFVILTQESRAFESRFSISTTASLKQISTRSCRPSVTAIRTPCARFLVPGAPFSVSPSPSSRLFQSSPSSNSDDNNNPEKQRNNNFLTRITTKLVNLRKSLLQLNLRSSVNKLDRLKARFQSLSLRAKKLLLAQVLLLVFIFGSLARVTVTKQYSAASSSRRPVEISYSRFLDLVEQQQKATTNTNDQSQIPVMDRVQIGSDRIVFRLYQNQQDVNVAAASTSAATSSSAVRATNTQLEQQPKIVRQTFQRIKRKRQPQQQSFVTAYTKPVTASPELLGLLRKNDISFAALAVRTNVLLLTARSFFVTFYFLLLWRLYKTISGAAGGGGGIGGANDAPGKLAQTSDLPSASFDDIQGIDGAKSEVMELVDALRFPEKYAILGARAPTGLLLEGPPGTGKTMLARATAATAGVPLLYCSGSDFVELFVGRGAARVRKLFERAEKLSPCIIFIDELDALGKSRDMGALSMSRGNDEAEQTLNQLLACMDGLDSSRRICVLAATNRKDVLDTALVRPGRFDRIVKLKLPDTIGRERILRVHCKKLPGFAEGRGLDPNRPGALGSGRLVDLSAIAAVTDGFSGAELEYLVNEAAIRAVRRVSAALRKGTHASDITPHVEAMDFEASLASFYESRRPTSGVSELWKNVWK